MSPATLHLTRDESARADVLLAAARDQLAGRPIEYRSLTALVDGSHSPVARTLWFTALCTYVEGSRHPVLGETARDELAERIAVTLLTLLRGEPAIEGVTYAAEVAA